MTQYINTLFEKIIQLEQPDGSKKITILATKESKDDTLTRHIWIKAEGCVKEKGKHWDDEWEFEFTKELFNPLLEGIEKLNSYRDSLPGKVEIRSEGYFRSIDWLQIGTIVEPNSDLMFAEFSKNGLTMRIPINSLTEFGDTIHTAASKAGPKWFN